MTAFLLIASLSASLFMISVRVVSAQRNTEMLKVRLFTLRLVHLGIVWLRFTSSVSTAPRLRQRSMRNCIGVANNVDLDRLDLVYLKGREIETQPAVVSGLVFYYDKRTLRCLPLCRLFHTIILVLHCLVAILLQTPLYEVLNKATSTS